MDIWCPPNTLWNFSKCFKRKREKPKQVVGNRSPFTAQSSRNRGMLHMRVFWVSWTWMYSSSKSSLTWLLWDICCWSRTFRLGVWFIWILHTKQSPPAVLLFYIFPFSYWLQVSSHCKDLKFISVVDTWYHSHFGRLSNYNVLHQGSDILILCYYFRYCIEIHFWSFSEKCITNYFVCWTWVKSCDIFTSRLSARGFVKAKHLSLPSCVSSVAEKKKKVTTFVVTFFWGLAKKTKKAMIAIVVFF